MNDQTAIDLGFDDAKEFFSLVSSVPIMTKKQRDRWQAWKDFDGTKSGLVKIIAAAKRPE